MIDEKIVQKGTFITISKLFIIVYSIVTLGISSIFLYKGIEAFHWITYHFDSMWEPYLEYTGRAWWYLSYPRDSRFKYGMTGGEFPDHTWLLFVAAIAVILLAFIILFVLIRVRSVMSLTITDKRVFGRAGIIKRVDLPNDMISAIATHFRSGITFATSSGKINFYFLENREEVFKAISEIINSRQDTKSTVRSDTVPFSVADEIQKYKSLLDSGTITQEEFDKKKKQLLEG